ncbi:MAG TPA: hypothetical protein VGG01_07695 [Xanthobacteraceae bacterium]|jgi:hypothetical protein
MSGSTGGKIFVTVLFVLVGLPPGLCSMFGMATALTTLSNPSHDAAGYAIMFGVPSLIGLAIFGLMLWWLIRTWRRPTP